MIALRPCPFCGETPDAGKPATFDCDQGGKWGFVVCCCRGPEVRTGYGPPATWQGEAVAAWNDRAADAVDRCVSCESTARLLLTNDDAVLCRPCADELVGDGGA